MKTSPSTKTRGAKHVYVRDFDGDLVILDLAGGDYYALDDIGARLWKGVTAGRTVADIARDLAPEYEVDLPVLERDLVVLLDELLAKGLLEVVD